MPKETGKGADNPTEWDDSAMTTAYSDVCRVIAVRDQIALDFENRLPESEAEEVGPPASNRISLSPDAARRLARLLEDLLGRYEKEFGPLGE